MLCERPVFRTGELTVDLSYRTVNVAGSTIKLSPTEYDLLRFLVQHAGKALTHGFLIEELWNEPVETQCLRVYVRQLRQKVEIDRAEPRYIFTAPIRRIPHQAPRICCCLSDRLMSPRSNPIRRSVIFNV
jgi:DNA-binding response OmpR family regulator